MIWTILAGAASGVISGMGIGGGAILIPVLTVFLGINQHVAQCANLYFFVPTAIAALIVHIRRRAVDFKTAIPIICFGLAGAAGGSYLAVALSTGTLRRVFGIFLALMGLYQFFGGKKR